MGAAFLITLREGLEGALIVAILLAYLRQLGRADQFVWVLGAAFVGVAVSLVAGIGVFIALGELEGQAEELTEGIIALVAVGVLTWMIFWMRQQARTIGGALRGRVDKALASGALLGLASIAFVGVVREGLETALFLIAADSGAANTLIGGLPGLFIAALLGFGIYKGSQIINLRAFFQVTGGLIILVAAGLFSKGVHELQEAGVISTTREQVWNIKGNPVFGHGEFFDFLKGLFGWSAAPSAEQLAVWVLFLGVASWFFYLDGRLPFSLRLWSQPQVAEAEVESDPAG
ncbi:MAG: FTR1 family protein [Chloroflexi bacterium]|nr:FTR1 family protein [Chloroflexota bacterium]